MNQHDRQNLEYLLKADEITLKHWYASTSADDHVYAQELMARYSQELRDRSLELKVEAELALMTEYPDALRVIDRVRN